MSCLWLSDRGIRKGEPPQRSEDRDADDSPAGKVDMGIKNSLYEKI